MNTERIVDELRAERDRLDRAIAAYNPVVQRLQTVEEEPVASGAI